MKINVQLITGSEWHELAYLFLKKSKINTKLFDDNSSCYLAKKYNIKAYKISDLQKNQHKNIFCWSPTNDFGSAKADFENKKKDNFNIRNTKFINGIFDKSKINSNKKNNISKKKKYLLKPKKGSGSRDISIWNFKKFDRKNFYIEEFYKGYELSVETISCKKYHQILNVSLRVLNNYKSAITIISIKKLKNQKKIYNQIYRKLDELSIENGICHLECKVDKKSNLFFFDINIRAGGFGVTDFMLNSLYDKNLYELDFKILTGKMEKINLKIKRDKIFFLIFKYEDDKLIKNDLSKINKKFIHKKIKNNKSNQHDDENDSLRTDLLFGFSNNKYQLKKNLSKIFDEEKSKLIFKQYFELSN